MQYRIVKIGDLHYPQWKTFIFWNFFYRGGIRFADRDPRVAQKAIATDKNESKPKLRLVE